MIGAALVTSAGAAGPGFAQGPSRQGAQLPAGVYECSGFLVGFNFIGMIDIRGNRYRGPSTDDLAGAPWHTYAVGRNGQVFLQGPFGAGSRNGNIVASSRTFIDSQSQTVLRVNINTPRDGLHEIDCVKMR